MNQGSTEKGMAKRICIPAGLLMLLLSATTAFSQSKNTDTLSFTISTAIDYAISNNPDLKNAYADIAIADQNVKEVFSIGLPQLRGQVAFQDAIQKQVFVFPNQNGVPTPIRVGNKYTTQASLNASWLLLDGTYFLGLIAAKQYTELSKRIASKTETDVKLDVAKTYFMVLITKENISLLETSYATLGKTYDQVKALNKEGFTESLDVDRIKLQLNNLNISLQKARDQYTVVLGLLKSKMGMPQSTAIKLTDDIESINQKLVDPDLETKVNLSTRTDYQILEQQLVLNKYNVQRFQLGRLPSLGAAFTYQQSNFSEKLDFSDWFSNYFLGLQLNVPIFSGFGQDARVQKARIEQVKTENTLRKVENLIDLEVQQNKLRYTRAMEYTLQQKENLELANRILNITTIKYNEGIGSNLELITANQDLKNSQTNYLGSIYDMLVAKLDFIAATGQNIKIQ